MTLNRYNPHLLQLVKDSSAVATWRGINQFPSLCCPTPNGMEQVSRSLAAECGATPQQLGDAWWQNANLVWLGGHWSNDTAPPEHTRRRLMKMPRRVGCWLFIILIHILMIPVLVGDEALRAPLMLPPGELQKWCRKAPNAWLHFRRYQFPHFAARTHSSREAITTTLLTSSVQVLHP